MTSCAGCSPLHHQLTDARIPSCLERIVFPYSAYNRGARISLRPSYQCLACNTIWMFDEQAGYVAERQLQRAA